MGDIADEVLDRERLARDCGLRLLELSRVYDDLALPAEIPPEWAVVAALAARQRRHLQAVIALADDRLFLEAQIIVRTMFEFHVRLRWLFLDIELHQLLWIRDDVGYRLTIDREARQGGLEIMRPEVLEGTQRTRDEIDARINEIAQNRGLDRVPPYGSLKQQAEAVGLEAEYTIAYRYDSQSAAHPSALALDTLLERLPDGGLKVLSEPPIGAVINVYGPAAIYVHAALQAAGEVVPELRLDGLDEVAGRLVGIGPVRPPSI